MAAPNLRTITVAQNAIRLDPSAYMEDLGFGKLRLLAKTPVTAVGV